MAVKRYNGSSWDVVAGLGAQGPAATSSSIATWVKTASGGETSLSGNDDNSQSLSYTVGQELVFINGALQKRGVDYTATTGTSITGLTALAASDVVTVWTVNSFSVANTYTQAQVDAGFIANSAYFPAGKNKIINGDFYWNQRAFTSTTANNAYSFDRWQQYNGGTSGTLTVTPQTFTAGTAPVTGYEGKNFVQCVTAAGANTDTYAVYGQKVEDVRTFANQTTTVSFWAKASSGTPKIAIEVVQSFGTGGSPSADVNSAFGTVTLSTSWARYSVTVAVPSISGKTLGTANDSYAGLNLWISAGSNFNTRASSIGLQNNTFQIWGVQWEAGSVATPFQTATGTIQGELAACQRYYQMLVNGNIGYFTSGQCTSTTAGSVIVPFVVTMRAAPSISFSAANHFTVNQSNGTATGLSSFSYTIGTINQARFDFTVASGLSAGNATIMATQNTSAQLTASAEL